MDRQEKIININQKILMNPEITILYYILVTVSLFPEINIIYLDKPLNNYYN